MRKTKGEGGAAGASEAAITGGPAPGKAAGGDAGAAATVAAYLQGHPDYFASNPQILAELHIPHTAAGAAVSLIERQVRVLRGQLDTERGRLAQLIARAREYESFSARLHALVLALIAAPDLTRVSAALQEGLTHEFSAQAVTLKVFPVDPAAGDPDPLVAAFRDFLERKHALCGPLDEAKNAALFGDLHDPAGEQVRCAALIPIRANGRCGVLAIGAADPDRFKPDMRTDLLDRLGEIVSCKLQILPPEVPSAVTPPPPTPASEDAPKPTPTRRKRAKKTVPE